VPPLVRSLPDVESLFLFREEESQEEAEAREALNLTHREASLHPPSVQDGRMEEETKGPLAEMERVESPAQINTTPIPLFERLSHSAIEQPDVRNGISRHPAFATAPSNSLPPPPESILGKNTAPVNIAPQSSAPRLHPIPITTVDKEEDEEMPIINLDSDSDGD